MASQRVGQGLPFHPAGLSRHPVMQRAAACLWQYASSRHPGGPLTVRAASDRAAAIQPLTGLRFLAAAWVLLYHYADTLVGLVPSLGMIRPVAAAGYVGVDLFFVLSGFIISHVYLHQPGIASWSGARRYLLLRLARFYPVHLLTLLIIAGLLTLERGTPQNWVPQEGVYTPVTFVRNLLLAHGWGNSFAWNGPAWSISAEWFAYLVFPLATVVLLRLSPGMLGFGAALSVPAGLALMAVLVPGFLHLESGPPILRIAGAFAAGCFIYRLYERRA